MISVSTLFLTPPFVAAKNGLDIDTAYEMKGRLAQIDANRMYSDDPFCKKPLDFYSGHEQGVWVAARLFLSKSEPGTLDRIPRSLEWHSPHPLAGSREDCVAQRCGQRRHTRFAQTCGAEVR